MKIPYSDKSYKSGAAHFKRVSESNDGGKAGGFISNDVASQLRHIIAHLKSGDVQQSPKREKGSMEEEEHSRREISNPSRRRADKK